MDGLGIESRWGGERDFPHPSRPALGAHAASCTMGTGSFLGVKRPGRGADHSPPSKCRGHERAGLYLYSPSGPSWPVIGSTFTFMAWNGTDLEFTKNGVLVFWCYRLEQLEEMKRV